MSWKITVLTPNGRRHTKSYSPDDTLLQVLDETCKKYEFKSEEFDLTHHNRVVDTNLILRFSGLPNNAFLEMAPIQRARKESNVTICLQLENGNRSTGTFTPSTCLHEIVTNLIPEEIGPTLHVIYMRREINGTQSLTETSLKSLGLTSGRAILRLIHRTPEQIKVQAHVSAPLPQKPKEEVFIEPTRHITNTTESKTSVNVDVLKNMKSAINETKNDETQKEIGISMIKEETNDSTEIKHIINERKVEYNRDEDMKVTNIDKSKEQSYLNEIITLGERNAIAFSQDMIEDMPFIDVPDNFYNLTVDEVKKLFLQLRNKREELENAPLLTSSLRASEVSKIDKYKSALIRVLFPDRIVLQGTFLPLDTIKTVKDFVKLHLQDSEEEFDLYLSPPKHILVDDVTLYDANCIPTAILHFGPHERHANTESLKCHYLKPEILLKLTPPKAALLSANLFK